MKDDREFWLQVRRGLLTIISAIESRWNLPRTSEGHRLTSLGQKPAAPPTAPQSNEPPPRAPAQSKHGWS